MGVRAAAAAAAAQGAVPACRLSRTAAEKPHACLHKDGGCSLHTAAPVTAAAGGVK